MISLVSNYRMVKKSHLDDSNLSPKSDDIDDADEIEIETGFDRGIDYEPMKHKLISCCNRYYDDLSKTETTTPYFKYKIGVIKSRIFYCCIAMIQLRNGSRISEACDAMKRFCKGNDFNKRVTVKIAKSESIKYKNGEQYTTKPRYRKMIFPVNWICNFQDVKEVLKESFNNIPFDRLKKRVLDYLLLHHDCNTHSLRYACINYLIYDKERPLNDVAKFVGHVDLSMLTRYTQQKNCEKIFDITM